MYGPGSNQQLQQLPAWHCSGVAARSSKGPVSAKKLRLIPNNSASFAAPKVHARFVFRLIQLAVVIRLQLQRSRAFDRTRVPRENSELMDDRGECKRASRRLDLQRVRGDGRCEEPAMGASQRMPTRVNRVPTLVVLVIALELCDRRPSAMATPIPAPDIPNNCNSNEHCCMPRPYTGKPKRQFAPDMTLPLRVRRPIHKLTAEAVEQLERGFALQRALPESDPRKLFNQAKLHCQYCDNAYSYPTSAWPLEIHNGWLFLPYHRMFTYFNERILAKLLNDDTFALPYWNWDNQTPDAPFANKLPDAFAFNKSSPLWNKNRNACALPPYVVDLNSAGGCTTTAADDLRTENTRLMYTQIVAGSPTANLFFGQPYSFGDSGGYGPGTLEDTPHGNVHLWVGSPAAATVFDDMGNFGRSARDPLFYSHHGNVDRIWELWKTLPGAQRREPEHRDFLDAQFTFYDENADIVIVNVSQILDTKAALRYEYEESEAAWMTNGEAGVPLCNPTNPSQTRAMLLTTRELSSTDVLQSQPLTFRVRRPDRASEGEEVLEIAGISLDQAKQAHWNAFLFFPGADATASVSCPEFAGTFNHIPHVGQAQMKTTRVWRVALRTKLDALGQHNSSHAVVTLAQFGPAVQSLQFAQARIVWDTSPDNSALPRRWS